MTPRWAFPFAAVTTLAIAAPLGCNWSDVAGNECIRAPADHNCPSQSDAKAEIASRYNDEDRCVTFDKITGDGIISPDGTMCCYPVQLDRNSTCPAP